MVRIHIDPNQEKRGNNQRLSAMQEGKAKEHDRKMPESSHPCKIAALQSRGIRIDS